MWINKVIPLPCISYSHTDTMTVDKFIWLVVYVSYLCVYETNNDNISEVVKKEDEEAWGV